jgi:hypothetical protein
MIFFLRKVLFFLLFVPVLYELKPVYRLIDNKYKADLPGREIYTALQKSKQKKKAKKVLLGDSVANQMFENTNSDTVNSLACNQSISMFGHYILLSNYLKNNQIDTVYMLFNPFSFTNNLNQIYTYHYFLKPFYKKAYRNEMSPTVIKQINKIPFKFLIYEPSVLTSAWAPNFVSKDTIDYNFLSPITIEYLHKIEALGEKYHFKIIMFPTPVSTGHKSEMETLNKNEIEKGGLSELFKNYFDDITYYDPSYFIDGTHFKNPEEFRKIYAAKWIK